MKGYEDYNIDPTVRKLVEDGLRGHFSISWERERIAANTKVTVFILKPSKDISLTFGLEREVAFFYANYPSIQPRTMQAIDQICREDPLSGRIDQSVFFLCAPDENLESFVRTYCSENPETRLVVPFSTHVLHDQTDNVWQIKNHIKNNLFIRNLFDYKLPLKSDTYFYGREDIVATVFDNIRKNQNTGIFGLRKTGKTSVLLKVQRLLQKTDEAYSVLIDCKHPRVRSGTAQSIARIIASEILRVTGKSPERARNSALDAFDLLDSVVREAPSRSKFCVIFDEIEYISPISPLNDWASEFIDLWQVLWTLQSVSKKICYIVCGVNPTVCDIDRFPSLAMPGRTVQNPMFSIFNVQFLRGFTQRNLSDMVTFFGSRMGLKFTPDALQYLHEHYGGHPMLSRLACSYVHETLGAYKIDRPIEIDRRSLEEAEAERDRELASYCGHVVSEIEELYPEEYRMLELLASGNIGEYYDLARAGERVSHIRNYGLVSKSDSEMPRFEMPVIRQYLRNDVFGGLLQSVGGLDYDGKLSWLKRRVRSLSDDLQLLDQACASISGRTIFGGQGPKKLHKLADLEVVSNEGQAVSFLVAVYKLLVEPADRFPGGLREAGGSTSPCRDTANAIAKIRMFRNYFCHDEVKGKLQAEFESDIRSSFDGKLPADVPDGWFLLQKTLLDRLHVALQIDISRF